MPDSTFSFLCAHAAIVLLLCYVHHNGFSAILINRCNELGLKNFSLHVVALCSADFSPPGRTLRKARRLKSFVLLFAERRQTKPANM